MFVFIFFKTMYNKTIIRFGVCDILNNQGLGKCYQPRPSARLITLTSTLIIPDITKTSSNNCLLSPKQSCPEPCWNFVLNRLYIIAIFTLPIHFGYSQHPPPQPSKKKTESCISIVFVLPCDVRLWYCDTQDNLKIFRFFVNFFWLLMNYGQRQSGEFSLPKSRALWLLITRRFSEFGSHAQLRKNYSGVENAFLHN